MIGMYKNGNYTVALLNDGSKIRYNNEDKLIPDRPESMDICISTYCRIGCQFCYEGCSTDGKHADIMNMKFIDTLKPYTEIALNGNEPLHPDLIPFLLKCKELKLVPSLTVNQYTFEANYDMLKKLSDDRLIYGLGVSLQHVTEEFIRLAKQLPNLVIHVVNGIVNMNDLYMLSGNELKILILGYKDRGRGKAFKGKNENSVKNLSETMKDMLPKIIDNKWFKVVSFDNLAIEQLDVKGIMSDDEWSRFYMGDDGGYTFYIDAVNEKFAESSVSDRRYPLLNDIQDMFAIIKNGRRG